MKTLHKYWPLLLFILSIVYALLYKVPLYVPLSLDFMIIALYALKKGLSLKQLKICVIEGFTSITSVMTLLSLIMIVIPLWIAAGTIPSLLTLGFKTLQGQNLVLIAFSMATLLSMVIGTAMGTMGILFSSFLVLGASSGIPSELMVGALVSGAYIGDRSALMSGSMHLNASVTQTQPRKNFIYMFRTLIPALVIALFAYGLLGNYYPSAENTTGVYLASIGQLESQFNISLISLSPLLILIGLIVIGRQNMKNALLWTIGYTLILLSVRLVHPLESVLYMIKGYSISMEPSLKLSSSGFVGIFPVLMVILFSTLLNRLFDELNLINPLLLSYMAKTKAFVPMSFKLGLLSILVSVITCSQTLMVVICGQHLKHFYDKEGYERKDLMLTIADYGIITVPMIPWNINGQMIAALTGVGALAYFPFAFVCLLLPCLNFVYSFIRQRHYR